MRWLQAIRERRDLQRQSLELGRVLEEQFNVPDMAKLRKWSRAKLFEQLAGSRLGPEDRMAAESELRRREAWDAPSGWAVRISVVALLLSLASLALSVVH